MEGFSRCLIPPQGCEARPLSNNVEFILSPCDTRRNEGSGTEKSIDPDPECEHGRDQEFPRPGWDQQRT